MAGSALALGTVLLGELALEEQLGASVYRVRRTRDGRELAVRIVTPRSAQEAADFLSLAATASRVRHPALASVEAYGRIDAESCYIATELVAGARLDEWADSVGIPPLVQVVELVRRLCVGLQAAARAGVVHDAIHARHVRVVGAGATEPSARVPVKLLGLGVPALLFDNQRDVDALRFMAPEQLQVLSRAELPTTFRCSAQMNVYSCGALLYYLATGGPPFVGVSAPELLAAQIGAPLAPPARINPQISAGLNAVVMRALELDPGDRYASVAELGEALAAVSGSLSPASRSNESSSMAPLPPDEGFAEEPPTSRTSVSMVAALEGSSSARAFETAPAERAEGENDKPTLPPGPPSIAASSGTMRDSVSGIAPIGLFSSSPPVFRSQAPVFSEVTNAGAPKPTPLAAFSEPPRLVAAEAPIGSNPPPAPLPAPEPVVAPEPPTLSAPRTSAIPLRVPKQQVPWPWLAFPLAAAVCLLAFFTVRNLMGSGETPAPVQGPPGPVASSSAPPADVASVAPPRVGPDTGAATGAVNNPELAPDPVQALAGEERRPRRRSRGHGSGSRAQAPARSGNAEPGEPTAPSRPLSLEHLIDEDVGLPDAKDAAAGPARKSPEPVSPPAPPVVSATPPEAAARVPAASRTQAPRPEAALPLTAKVQISDVEIRGSLPTSQVRHAIEHHRARFQRCYEQAAQAAGRNGFGVVTVTIELDESGRARTPRVHGAGLPGLDSCVSETALRIKTGRPPDTGTLSATWKIAFTP